ncbi:MAG: thioredoxin-dependent thiol peroxidase [Bacteroidota bacterium]
MSDTLLATGSPVPNLSLTNQDGESVNLADMKGQKLIVYFYPKDNSGSCVKEAESLRDGYADLKAQGYEVIGVSPDSEKSHRNFITKRELPFTLISDPEHKLTEAFGAWGEKKMYGKTYMGLLRSTFLVDENGVISHVIPKVKTKAHATQILDLLQN